MINRLRSVRSAVAGLAVLTGLVILLGLAGCGGDTHDHPVRAELIVSVDTARAGESFLVGVFLTIEPEWHVYWKYSGDAGLPTEINWLLPEGWSVAEIQWPVPKRFIENGPLTTYGYTDSVLLMAEVSPPDDFEPGARIQLAAQVDWMVCHDECVPGKANVALDLPTSASPSQAASTKSVAQSRIQGWLDRLPVDAESSGWVVDVQSSPGNNPQTLDVRLNIIHSADRPQASVEWFPAPSTKLLVKNINVATLGSATVVSFSVHSMFGSVGAGEMFESLLVYRDSSDRERGVRLVTPLDIQPVS